LNTARQYMGLVGDSTAALSFGGGTTANVTTTEKFTDTA